MSVTRATNFLLSNWIALTRPTTTPALFTGARTFRPPMFSNSAYRHSDFAYYGGFDFDRYLYVKYTQRF